MRAKTYALVAASTLLMASLAAAAEKQGKPLMKADQPAASEQRSDDWRERAMRSRAEVPDDAPVKGTARAVDERGDRRDGHEAGGGRLGKDGELKARGEE